MNDFKFASRQLFKRPGGTIIILVTLSLVIGTMSLVLGVMQHERNAWMPFPEPDEVVRVWQVDKNGPRDSIPAAVYADALNSLEGFESFAAMGRYGSQVLTGEGEARTLSIQLVTASVFDVAGVPPRVGTNVYG